MYLLHNHPEEAWQVLPCISVSNSQRYELTFAIAFRLFKWS